MLQVTCATVWLCTLQKSSFTPCQWDGMRNRSAFFSGPGMNPCQWCAGDTVMLVGSSCTQTSDPKTGLSPHPLPNLPLHAIHITENRDFCPYRDAGVGGAWWKPCSASCPAQHGSTCTMFHKANTLHMAPCLWLCSVELGPERKKVKGVIGESVQKSPALFSFVYYHLSLTHPGCSQETCLLLHHPA